MSVAASAGRPAPKRWALVVLALLGVGLIAAPAIFQMFDRAPKGATMIREFKPYMTNARLASFTRDIQQIQDGVQQGNTSVARHLSGSAGTARFPAAHPEFASFASAWPPTHADMSDLLNRIHAQVPNYLAVAALPKFTLFPWFFVIPGALVLLLSGAALLRPAWWRTIRWALVAIGVGLVLAPVAFQMFDRAPKGAKMVSAFTTIETRRKVETIQGYFGTIAAGQGSVRLDLVPALRRTGLSDRQIAERFPAVQTLDRRWIAILQNLTPMIGAMSDNVGNYQAVAALPSFTLFPWFFVLPGLIAIALAIVAGPRRSRREERAEPVVQSPPRPRPESTS
ncbi:MAG TPA: hypothetical protein VII98_01830 [Solirubrobacteraceae bacterium]